MAEGPSTVGLQPVNLLGKSTLTGIVNIHKQMNQKWDAPRRLEPYTLSSSKNLSPDFSSFSLGWKHQYSTILKVLLKVLTAKSLHLLENFLGKSFNRKLHVLEKFTQKWYGLRLSGRKTRYSSFKWSTKYLTNFKPRIFGRLFSLLVCISTYKNKLKYYAHWWSRFVYMHNSLKNRSTRNKISFIWFFYQDQFSNTIYSKMNRIYICFSTPPLHGKETKIFPLLSTS